MGVTENMSVPCYICETKNSAGIFLSKEGLERKPYAEHIKKRIKYNSYPAAETAFFQKYGNVVEEETFQVNTLFKVRSTAVYSVITSINLVMLTRTDDVFSFLHQLHFCGDMCAVSYDYLEFEEAQMLAKKKIADFTGTVGIFFEGNLRLNQPIFF